MVYMYLRVQVTFRTRVWTCVIHVASTLATDRTGMPVGDASCMTRHSFYSMRGAVYVRCVKHNKMLIHTQV